MDKLTGFLIKVCALTAVLVGGAIAQQRDSIVFSEDFEGTDHVFKIAPRALPTLVDNWVVGSSAGPEGSRSAYGSYNEGVSDSVRSVSTGLSAEVGCMRLYTDFLVLQNTKVEADIRMGDAGVLRIMYWDDVVNPDGSPKSWGVPDKYERTQKLWSRDWRRWTLFTITNAEYVGKTIRLVFEFDVRLGANTFKVESAAIDNIVVTGYGYSVKQSGSTFTITPGSLTAYVQAAIDTVKNRARGQDCTIRFGGEDAFLDIGSENITFDGGTSGTDWGNITFSGSVESSFASTTSSANYGTIYLKNGVSVENTAEIRNTATSNSIAIRNNSSKPLKIIGGSVSSASGTAIYSENTAATIEVLGGTVSTTTGTAISGGDITVNGGTISATTGTAINSSQNITLLDGTISATSGTAISATGASSVVTVKKGAVSTTGTNAAINVTGANASVVVSGGEVKATAGRAISTAGGGAAVTVSGGSVSAGAQCAIYADNAGAVVAVSGGTVFNSGTTDVTPTIYMVNPIPATTGANITISGTGGVQNIATSGGYAIRTFGSVSVSGGAQVNSNGYTVSLESMGVPSTMTISGGTVSAGGTGNAVHAIGSRVTVIATGGTVSAGAGSAVNAAGPNGVVYVGGGEVTATGTRIGTSGSNTIAIERRGAGSKYAEGSSTDLTVSPAGASAVWAVNGGKSGITYTRNTNTGFFEISGVTVETQRTNVSAKITFANGSAAYSGAQHTHETASVSGITAGAGPKWTYTYAVGASPTGNESFGTDGKPVNAGNYSVTVVYEDAANDGAKTASFTVTKINPTVFWPTGITAEAGQALSDISLASFTNASGTAGTFSWTSPSTAVGSAGSRSHNVTFFPVDGGNYNTLTQNVTVIVSGGTTAIQTPERVVPAVRPNEETTVAAPAVVLSGEFSAGPNPVSKRSGIVNFYHQGSRAANCELRVYSATGNVISKVKISDSALNSLTKRKIGSWDLRDKRGNLVPDGTYLVKGVIKTSGGRGKKVSVILDVR